MVAAPEPSTNIVTIIVAIIGAITGAVSLGILIYKTRKEKPKLDFSIENAYYVLSGPAEGWSGTTFMVFTRIDNKGERGTTIHHTTLSLEYNGQKYTLEPHLSEYQTINVMPHASIRHYFRFALRDVNVEGEIRNSSLYIGYTHGYANIPIRLITKS